VQVNRSEACRSLRSVKFSVPMTVPDEENRTPNVFNLEADSLFDAKSGACKESVQRPKLPLGLRDDGGNLIGRKRRLSLFANLSYLHEVLTRIADHPINRIDELLPWNIAATLAHPVEPAA